MLSMWNQSEARPPLRTWQALVLLLAIWAGIFLPGLGDTEIKGEEWRRILPGRAMMQSGDWVVPQSAGKPYSRKPPLINWAVASSFQLQGAESEWAARLPSVVAVALLGVVILISMRALLGQAGALCAAIFAISHVAMIDKGRLAEIEPLYISCFGIALCLWLSMWVRRYRWRAWVLPFVFLGLGLLAKGPLHVLYFYIILFFLLKQTGRLKELFSLPHVVGLLVMLGVALPWFWLNAQMNPSQDSSAVWLEQLTSRLGLSEFEWKPWLLQIPQSVLNLLPWACFLPLLWHRSFLSRCEFTEEGAKVFLGLRRGIFWAFLLIAILPSSRPRFTMPLLIPLCILLVWALLRVDEKTRGTCLKWWWRVWCVLAVIVLVGAWASAYTLWAMPQGGGQIGLWVLLVVGVMMGVVFFWKQRASLKTMGRLAAASGCLMAAGMCVYAMGAVPWLNQHENIRPVGEAVLKYVPKGEKLVVYKVGPKPFVYYLGAEAYEVALSKQLPEGVRRVLLPERRLKEERARLERKYGKGMVLTAVESERDRERYVLLGF